MIETAKTILLFSVIFLAAAACAGIGLEMWIRNAKRWRLIRNAYAEGLKDGKALVEKDP